MIYNSQSEAATVLQGSGDTRAARETFISYLCLRDRTESRAVRKDVTECVSGQPEDAAVCLEKGLQSRRLHKNSHIKPGVVTQPLRSSDQPGIHR